MSRPYHIKNITAHNDNQVTIDLYEELEYSNGKVLYINLISNSKPKSIFDKSLPSLSESLNLKANDLIHVNTARIKESTANSWFDDLSVVSKVE